jgi:predicted phosphate transport protein (TIGR00153 family)
MFKKKDIFFRTLEEMADTLVVACEYFNENVSKLHDVSAFAKQMKNYETQCDKYTHTILTELNKTFITPIEREDIMALTKSLDDVLDGIEACASRFEMYQIKEHDEYISLFADNIVRCSHQIKKAIYLLTQKKLLAMREPNIAINELENQADDLLRVSITSLFSNVKDPIELIKRKEIYERLEQTTDYCEDVANTLESIIMRNS